MPHTGREYLPTGIIEPAQALLPALVAQKVLPTAKAYVEYIDPSLTAEAMTSLIEAKKGVIVGGFFLSYGTPPKTKTAADVEHFFFPRSAALPDMKARPPLGVIVFGMTTIGSTPCVRMIVPGWAKPLLMSFAKFKACARPFEGHRAALEARDAAKAAKAAKAAAHPKVVLTAEQRARQIAMLSSAVFPRLLMGMSLAAIFPSGTATESEAAASLRHACFVQLQHKKQLPDGVSDAKALTDDHIRTAIKEGHLKPEEIVAPATKPTTAAKRTESSRGDALVETIRRQQQAAKKALSAIKPKPDGKESTCSAASAAEAATPLGKGARLDADVADAAPGELPVVPAAKAVATKPAPQPTTVAKTPADAPTRDGLAPGLVPAGAASSATAPGGGRPASASSTSTPAKGKVESKLLLHNTMPAILAAVARRIPKDCTSAQLSELQGDALPHANEAGQVPGKATCAAAVAVLSGISPVSIKTSCITGYPALAAQLAESGPFIVPGYHTSYTALSTPLQRGQYDFQAFATKAPYNAHSKTPRGVIVIGADQDKSGRDFVIFIDPHAIDSEGKPEKPYFMSLTAFTKHTRPLDRSATLDALSRRAIAPVAADATPESAGATCLRRTQRAGVLCATRAVPAAFSLYQAYRMAQAAGTGALWVWNSLPSGMPEMLFAAALGSTADSGAPAAANSSSLVCYPGDMPDPSGVCPAPGARWF